MNKNFIIGLLTLVSLLSLTYGYFQKVRADEQEAIAIENVKIARAAESKAEEMQKNAERQTQIAALAAEKSRELLEKAMEASAESKKKK